jgi:sec-independent protein translocase protein TatA
MFNVGPTELMLILVLALIVFGPKKLPEMGKSIGKGLREFQKAKSDIRREISEGLNESPAKGSAPASADVSTSAPAADGQGSASSDGQGAAEKPSH